MTYNGYLVLRPQVLSGSTALAVGLVAFFWSVQHAFMLLTFDQEFMLHRFLSSIWNSVFMIVAYLHVRRRPASMTKPLPPLVCGVTTGGCTMPIALIDASRRASA